MLVLTFALPRGGALRDSQLVQFPLTVGVWSIFVLLFVKLNRQQDLQMLVDGLAASETGF
jgi:hypothetical protein